MGTVTVQLLGFDLTSMTNLRLLCVLIVLAAVCWEANCYSTKNCGHFNKKIYCNGGKVLKITYAKEGVRRWTLFFWGATTYKHSSLKWIYYRCNGHSSCTFGSLQNSYHCIYVSYKCVKKHSE